MPSHLSICDCPLSDDDVKYCHHIGVFSLCKLHGWAVKRAGLDRDGIKYTDGSDDDDEALFVKVVK